MALYGKATSYSKLVINDHFSLSDLVKSFNTAINEEQAWAVCFQCAQFFLRGQPQEKYQDLYLFGSQALRLSKDGEINIDSQVLANSGSGKGPPDNRNSLFNKGSRIAKERDAVQALGLAIYHAMDYGMGETEERQLSPDLEDLITNMTEVEEEDDSACADDEGIEKDAEDDDDRHRHGKHSFNFYDIAQCCIRHVSSRQDPHHHYKAVCHALVTEAQELITFLDKISSDQKNLAKKKQEVDVATVEELERADWARLWVQIMRQLRNGVRLKKVEHVTLPQIEFELTPFEILLEDIRSRRYNLHKIMVNGTIPPKVKNDAHAVILDFIRSRPPLRNVKDRKLKSPPPKVHDPRECLLNDIRSMPKLRPIKDGRLVGESNKTCPVETSRTRLNSDSDESPLPVRKVIKPDFNLLLNDSFEEEASEDEESVAEARHRVQASQISPLSPVSPVHDHITPNMDRPILREGSAADRACKLQRRHTIMVCESPTDGKVIQKELPPLEEDPEREEEEEVEFQSQCSASQYTSLPAYCSGNFRRHQTSPNSARQMASERTEHRKSSAGSLSAIPEVDDNCADVSDHVHEGDLSELNASDLMHVNWNRACPREAAAGSNNHVQCQDCRPRPKKWQNPIECLNLTLEEVTHIRTVLTKAELESLITQPELYSQVAKGKLCFSCKITKFALFGEWGTRCRFCKRTVCSKCLRKMQVPTDHFKNIPVYTLSPTPLSPDMKEAIDNYRSLSPTGSSPPTPAAPRRPNLDNRLGRKKPLQRSQSMLIKPSAPKVVKAPLMNICCDCKDMVTEIVRAGRTSISLINQGKDPTTEVRLNLVK